MDVAGENLSITDVADKYGDDAGFTAAAMRIGVPATVALQWFARSGDGETTDKSDEIVV